MFQLKKQQQLQQQILHEQFQAQKQQLAEQHEQQLRQHLKVCIEQRRFSLFPLTPPSNQFNFLSAEFKPAPKHRGWNRFLY